MKVSHRKCQGDPAKGSAKSKVWVYRTEVANTLDRPIRVIWFDFYFKDEHGEWYGTNIRKQPLRNRDFLDWYGDEADQIGKDGWMPPGAVAICDPNYQLAFDCGLTETKWCYLAVDREGNDYYAEAMVTDDVIELFEPEPANGA